MPRNFSTILFWFSGAFTASLYSIIVENLYPNSSSAEKLALQQKVRPLQEQLAIGKLVPETFCRKVMDTLQVDVEPTLIPETLGKSLKIDQAFFNIYQQISNEFDPRVIVDIPEIWFRQLIKCWNVEESFPDGRLIFLEQSGLGKLIPDVFQYIPKAAGRKMEECIVVDPIQMRAVMAHKQGLVSTAYVYPRRLKIDLALQGIWKTTENVYHPKAGARTDI